jgi:signal transduction histidine kinase
MNNSQPQGTKKGKMSGLKIAGALIAFAVGAVMMTDMAFLGIGQAIDTYMSLAEEEGVSGFNVVFIITVTLVLIFMLFMQDYAVSTLIAVALGYWLAKKGNRTYRRYAGKKAVKGMVAAYVTVFVLEVITGFSLAYDFRIGLPMIPMEAIIYSLPIYALVLGGTYIMVNARRKWKVIRLRKERERLAAMAEEEEAQQKEEKAEAKRRAEEVKDKKQRLGYR